MLHCSPMQHWYSSALGSWGIYWESGLFSIAHLSKCKLLCWDTTMFYCFFPINSHHFSAVCIFHAFFLLPWLWHILYIFYLFYTFQFLHLLYFSFYFSNFSRHKTTTFPNDSCVSLVSRSETTIIVDGASYQGHTVDDTPVVPGAAPVATFDQDRWKVGISGTWCQFLSENGDVVRCSGIWEDFRGMSGSFGGIWDVSWFR